MSDKIINAIPFKDYTLDQIKKIYGKKTKVRAIDVEGVTIKLKLNKEDIEKYYENWYLQIDEHVEKTDAEEWIKTKLAGNITMKQLDQQRTNEVNALDIM